MYRVVMVAGRIKRGMYTFETEIDRQEEDSSSCSLSQMDRRKRGKYYEVNESEIGRGQRVYFTQCWEL